MQRPTCLAVAACCCRACGSSSWSAGFGGPPTRSLASGRHRATWTILTVVRGLRALPYRRQGPVRSDAFLGYAPAHPR